MNEELKSLLCVYLGDLLFKIENEYDWIEREGVIEKINAVNVLLGIGERMKTPGDAMREFFESEIKLYEK
jgi:hypothetical protein